MAETSWRRYLRFWGTKVEADVDDELRFHFDMRVREYIARGMSEEEARAAVVRRLGDVQQAKSECQTIGNRRDRRRTRAEELQSLGQDIRLAARGLWRRKGWTAVAVLTLALGIGATTTLFTIIDAVVLRPLPFPQADRVISISEKQRGTDMRVAHRFDYLEWKRSSHTLEAVAAYLPGNAAILVGSDPEQIQGTAAAASYFSVFGVAAEYGRTFAPDEDRPESPAVIVLSDQLWRRAFRADTGIVGTPIRVGDARPIVIGIMPPGFTTRWGAQYWMPLVIDPAAADNGALYSIVGRLRPDVSVEDARRELTALDAHAQTGPGVMRGESPIVMTLHDRRYGDLRRPLFLLLGAVGVLLLIACANVANLMLARGALRQTEFGVRIALGASRWRLIRYLLCESVLLSLAGALVGLAIPPAVLRYFIHLSPTSIAHMEGIHVNETVLWASVAIAVATGVLFGLAPALDAIATDLHDVLKEAGGRASHSARRTRIRRALVVGEIAAALILVTGAGLLTKSFTNVALKDPGFRPEGVLEADVFLPLARYPNETAWRAFSTTLATRVRALPGVTSVALADIAPLGGSSMSMSVHNADGTDSPNIDLSDVGSGYFETLGIPLLSGRTFSTVDGRDSNTVAVINAALAHALFPGVNPIGRHLPFQLDSPKPITVIGVVRDVPQQGLDAAPAPEVYRLNSGTTQYLRLLVRTAASPEALEGPVRHVVTGIDPLEPVASFTTMQQAMSEAVAPRRFSMALLATFASLATVLAAIGLYGIMSHAVAERKHELGVRIALGADARRVTGLVIAEGMTLTAIGLGLGMAGSFATVRLLSSMLYEVPIHDPVVFVIAAVVLAAVSLLASYLPARRVARVDPVVALRGE